MHEYLFRYLNGAKFCECFVFDEEVLILTKAINLNSTTTLFMLETN